jgi:hypothetical protein
VGKYGTNLEGFGGFEGGVNADKGAPLVSTSSDGETALLFGPAALREIQAGVANGDFAIPPDAAGDTITAENPLPYWTFTDVNSAGAITCAIVADAGAGSGNVLRWSIAASTGTGLSAKITRFVPIAGTANRAFAYLAEATFKASATTTSLKNVVTMQYYKGDGVTTTGTAVSNEQTFNTAQRTVNLNLADANVSPPADAAFALITITTSTHSTTPASITTSDVYEVGLYNGGSLLVVAENTSPSTYYPAVIKQTSGVLMFDPALKIQISGDVQLSARTGSAGDLTAAGKVSAASDITAGGDIGFDGEIYATTALTGPSIILGGTNARLWAFSNSSGSADLITTSSSTRAGVLITKPTAGQPSTNINGTANTDAFADALRNGGIAVDTTNNRAYFYDSGWKYADLTTPSDSRLKEQITEISGALDTLRQLMPVAFKWKAPEAHGRTDCVADDGTRLGFIADHVATTDLAHWVETLGVDDREAHLVDTTEVLAVNIPQNEMEALVVQALLDIDARLKELEEA